MKRSILLIFFLFIATNLTAQWSLFSLGFNIGGNAYGISKYEAKFSPFISKVSPADISKPENFLGFSGDMFLEVHLTRHKIVSLGFGIGFTRNKFAFDIESTQSDFSAYYSSSTVSNRITYKMDLLEKKMFLKLRQEPFILQFGISKVSLLKYSKEISSSLWSEENEAKEKEKFFSDSESLTVGVGFYGMSNISNENGVAIILNYTFSRFSYLKEKEEYFDAFYLGGWSLMFNMDFTIFSIGI